MMNMLKNLHKEESGQDLIEYALIGLIIALGAIAGMGTVASSINAEFTQDCWQTQLIARGNQRICGMRRFCETLRMIRPKGACTCWKLLRDLHKEESGQDLIEYALIGLIIALGAIAGMGTVASSINAEFSKIAGKLNLTLLACGSRLCRRSNCGESQRFARKHSVKARLAGRVATS